MKKFFSLVLFVVFALSLNVCPVLAEGTPDARSQAVTQSQATARTARTAVPIPQLSYFQELKTAARWAERWDKPSVVTFVYLVSFGKVLGYYVADGKPASTRSYITPESHIGGGGTAGYYEESLPDLDGTYGENNVGIRFFTAEGVASEWGGNGMCYLYTDAPADFGYEVPRLYKKAGAGAAGKK